jgi:large subunit ribosomal protein L15
MNLSDLRPADGSKHSNNFRRGRGHASGNGKTAGKGHKGQKARHGVKGAGFEGGQMPLYRRLPKRGFHNRNAKIIIGVGLSRLNRFEDGDTISIKTLQAAGLVKNPRDGVKLLANGEILRKLTIADEILLSAAAREKITAKGGTVPAVIDNAKE